MVASLAGFKVRLRLMVASLAEYKLRLCFDVNVRKDPLPDVPTPPVLRQASVGSACRDCFRNVCQSIVFVRVGGAHRFVSCRHSNNK